MAAQTRIYLVTIGENDRLVRATHPSHALMHVARDIAAVKLPPTAKMKAAGRAHHKTANLAEAYRYFTGREIENAHSALADVDACMAVYFAIQAGVREPVAA